MENLADLIATLDGEVEEEFENRLRSALETKDRAWLLENLYRHLDHERHLKKNPQRQLARRAEHVEPPAERRRRLARIRKLGLDASRLGAIVERYRSLDRERLESEGFLVEPPHKGQGALGPGQRSEAGEQLLQEARDVFYALLFGDEKIGVRLPRDRRDFLTVTLPSAKSNALERFMLAVTKLEAQGTWLDPEGVSDDVGAPNTVLQVEFGDSADEAISKALLVVIAKLNDLEVNEQILYARIEDLERSSLV